MYTAAILDLRSSEFSIIRGKLTFNHVKYRSIMPKEAFESTMTPSMQLWKKILPILRCTLQCE